MSMAHRLFLLPVLSVLLTAGAPDIGYRGFNPRHVDPATEARVDFWQYANGGWAKATKIPAEYDRFGVDQELDRRTSALLKSLLEEAAAKASGAPRGSEIQKVGDFFASGMDEAAIAQAGLKPLAPTLAAIDALKDRRQLALEMGRLHAAGVGVGFGFHVAQDDKESTRYIATMEQGGLGLPDRDFYFGTDPKFQSARQAYRRHLEKVFGLMGESASDARRHARSVFTLESRLAKVSMTGVERRDPLATYHKMDRASLDRIAPRLDWDAYFNGLGATPGELVVRQPRFLTGLSTLTKEMDLGTWKAYLRWQVVSSASPFLPKAFEEAHFDFYQRTLQGVETPHPRWKRVCQVVDGCMGEALGRLYVAKAFAPESKAKVAGMVENLRTALRTRIEGLAWMAPETKVKALEKLSAMRVKIGYPDVWRDYSALSVSRGSYLENVLAAGAFEVKRNLAKLGQPIDRTEWDMSPQTNNAYYSPNMNEICFPAGILQPPYFDPAADDAVNYGNIGATIGHEMTHGFDDQGRLYDAQGNMHDWWTPSDVKAYTERTQLIVKQFNAFEALPGKHINGELTLGENIADLGGLLIAWDAWKLSQKGLPAAQAIDGFTPEQRFFMGYAETWRTVIRPEALGVALVTDVHSPAKWRVNGPLANLPEFWQAFQIPEGHPMRRPDALRPTIW